MADNDRLVLFIETISNHFHNQFLYSMRKAKRMHTNYERNWNAESYFRFHSLSICFGVGRAMVWKYPTVISNRKHRFLDIKSEIYLFIYCERKTIKCCHHINSLFFVRTFFVLFSFIAILCPLSRWLCSFVIWLKLNYSKTWDKFTKFFNEKYQFPNENDFCQTNKQFVSKYILDYLTKRLSHANL